MHRFVVRIFTNFPVTSSTELLGRSEAELQQRGIEILFNQSGCADLALVLNTAVQPRWIAVPRGGLLKVLQEPVIRNPLTHLFTYHHSRVFDQIRTHSPQPNSVREILSLPLTGSFVDPSEPQSIFFNEKKHSVSIIASTLASLPGHQTRTKFINDLLALRPELKEHTFGRGRPQSLENKVDGLAPYRYSIAIENSQQNSYITEKFYDCIICGTVPLYFGAPNIGDYFPSDCFIRLPIDDINKSCEIIDELSLADYEKRIPALIEARALIRDKYSLGAIINDYRASASSKRSSRTKLVFFPQLDGFIIMIQKSGILRFLKRAFRNFHT